MQRDVVWGLKSKAWLPRVHPAGSDGGGVGGEMCFSVGMVVRSVCFEFTVWAEGACSTANSPLFSDSNCSPGMCHTKGV